MRYISTRGYAGPNGEGVSFYQAMLDGLAPDGGLYLPAEWPQFLPRDVVGKGFPEIAEMIMAPFVVPDLSQRKLRQLIEKACANFEHPEVTPLAAYRKGHHILELFHGPTLAFKDVALQMLGLLLDEALAKKSQNLTVLGATSGDTGPAAIEGLKGRDHVQTFMLFPAGRISPVQRRQMTTVAAENVRPVAVKGTFDDCQKLVKEMFNHKPTREKYNLTAINSISWARLLPQMVYYFYAWAQLQKPLTFSVPTGNFGDVFAGFMARKCGLPMNKLIIATNKNDILPRFIKHGDYSNRGVHATQSPSMDISVASNFERYLYLLSDGDGVAVKAMMETFEKTGALPELSKEQMQKARHDFAAFRAYETNTTEAIQTAWRGKGVLVDPHTAVGLHATQEYLKLHPEEQVVTLATAHPAKFADAVEKATGRLPKLPERLMHIMEAEENFDEISAEAEALKKLMEEKML
mgnify:CR=1 FL=1